MELPDRSSRPRAFDFDPSRYQWRTGRAPERILKDGQEIPNPFYRSALFVVHGIGDQKDTDTLLARRT